MASQTAFCASGSQSLVGVDANLLRDLQNGSSLSAGNRSTEILNIDEITPSE